MHRKLRLVEAEIQDFTSKGNGLGTFCQSESSYPAVEVPFTMPGERANVLLFRKRGGVYSGRLQDLLKPSDKRVAPRCIHFGTCGGCRWQHLPYQQQLERKESFIRNCFKEMMTPGVTFKSIVPCEPPWQYRNKMEFTFSNSALKEKFLGLIMDSSRGKVLNITECHLVDSWFVQALSTVRTWWMETELEAYYPPRNSGSLRTLTLREGGRSGDRMAILTVSGNPEYALKKQQLESFVSCLRQAIEPIDSSQLLSIFLRIQQTAKGMATQFYEMHLYGPDHLREKLLIYPHESFPPLSLQFKVSPTAFFQPNTRQAEKLYSLALQHLSIPEGSTVYDLYCGTGTLGICAAKGTKEGFKQGASKVIGIEISLESSLDAQTNAVANKCPHVEILTGSVPEVILKKRQEGTLPLPDVIMVDPPRVGLDAIALEQILKLRPKKILYISCNPATQAPNIAHLISGGYRLTILQPVDQFPQTPHVEIIAILELGSND